MSGVSESYGEALEPVLLALADDDLIIGHRHSEWTGWAPHIEEDIAFSSIAQDEIGHANLFFNLLAELRGESADRIALGREVSEYTNAIICERPNRDWAYTVSRHFLYEEAERVRLESLSGSSYQPLAEVCAKLLREEKYHQLHADAWFRRLAHGPVEGRHQLAVCLSECLPDALGLFEELPREAAAIENGILPQPNAGLREQWLNEITRRVDDSGVPLGLDTGEEEGDLLPTSSGEIPDAHHDTNPATEAGGKQGGIGGRRGRHSAEFSELWDDLTRTYREEPTATW